MGKRWGREGGKREKERKGGEKRKEKEEKRVGGRKKIKKEKFPLQELNLLLTFQIHVCALKAVLNIV